MVNYTNVKPNDLIEELSKELKEIKECEAPEWAQFVKTGNHKERAPVRDDWWNVRQASVLRKIALLGPIGVSKLRRKYGGRKNRGHKPDKFVKGSGNIIRKCLQQLEKAGFVKQDNIKGHKGRVVTPKGHSLLDKTANKLIKVENSK